MFPAVIYDDFFENPDLVVDLANSLEFEMGDGAWPGTRTKELGEIKGTRSFADSVTDKVLRMFYPDKQYHYFAKRVFQKIKGFHEDQFHVKNRGWIHKDSGRAIGGIIYLDKEPEEETGTSLYRNKQLVFPHTVEEDSLKRRWYTGQDVSDEEYHKLFYSNPTHFEETVKVKNVYNRLFMFNGNQYHGVQTYGSPDRDRLTLAFFVTFVNHYTHTFPTLRE
tara:strand:- start:683 stop:1345 length:663 start_codon:yes stop_codon:yes gene_type:complete